ncbi:MAG: hypothetical protein O7F08_06340 [Deltaproteobacteria bacterium]|nr:hypothetical protein [Deltaproteobacteria bacterium]
MRSIIAARVPSGVWNGTRSPLRIALSGEAMGAISLGTSLGANGGGDGRSAQHDHLGGSKGVTLQGQTRDEKRHGEADADLHAPFDRTHIQSG